jgi:hypothetical protein
MNQFLVVHAIIAALFALMAFRAVRSASVTDYLLAGTQCLALLLLLGNYRQFALYLLLITALAYLISQIVTGARLVSRSLPLAGAAMIVLALLEYPARFTLLGTQ